MSARSLLANAVGASTSLLPGGPLRRVPAPFRDVQTRRMRALLSHLSGQSAPLNPLDVHRSLCAAIDASAEPAIHWLAVAVLGAGLPQSTTIAKFRRSVALDGASQAIDELLSFLYRADVSEGVPLSWTADVEIVADSVCVDTWLTSKAEVATGIQRVVRETVRRWTPSRAITLLGWTDDQTALRRLRPDEELRTIGDPSAPPYVDEPIPCATVVIPWGGVFVEPELVGDPPRALRLMCLAEHSKTELSCIVYDSVPVSSSETTNTGVSGSFGKYLSAVKHASRLAADSHSAANEYAGFREMLAAQGLQGPDIIGLPLAIDAPAPDPDVEEDTRDRLGAYTLPLVLCVGSHEPRKNHLAVLQAAELAWRDGHRFALAFVGGSGWHSEQFDTMVRRLSEAARPVTSVRALPDAMLWAAYRIARCVVFPSTHEGYGLPVAEAIAAGTPVITSDFGSMREVADSGGALLIDPRDDHALRDALVRLLTDDALNAQLREQARGVPARSWDDYAAEAWTYLVDGVRPD